MKDAFYWMKLEAWGLAVHVLLKSQETKIKKYYLKRDRHFWYKKASEMWHTYSVACLVLSAYEKLILWIPFSDILPSASNFSCETILNKRFFSSSLKNFHFSLCSGFCHTHNKEYCYNFTFFCHIFLLIKQVGLF